MQSIIGSAGAEGEDIMNILVCVKQVPDTSEIRIDPVKNTLIRDGVPSILNPFDSYALEAAARIRDKDPGTKIVVVSMGPPQAHAVIRECLASAADSGYLISGRTFGGSDTFATSYILSCAVRKIEETEGKFDAIFCGKQAIDGDTAQVGPEMAEHLGLPQVTYAIEAERSNDGLKILKETDEGREIIGVGLPCVVTFTKPAWDLRFPTIKRRIASRNADVPVISDADLTDIDPSRTGLKGSPTKVRSTFVPQRRKSSVIIGEETVRESVKKLCGSLSAAGAI